MVLVCMLIPNASEVTTLRCYTNVIIIITLVFTAPIEGWPGRVGLKRIQNMYILGEDEGLILKAVKGFVDSVRWHHVDTCCGCI